MARDLIYKFDKNTFIGSELGEIQADFNVAFTIDGTKDSSQMIVRNFDGEELEPYTLLYHERTYTWWIVSHDKVERFVNETGFIYVHNLELLGAVELLNARDLTDCGFNDNSYTVNSFINRLISLSNFEYPTTIDNEIGVNFLNRNVDFIKTFENYTLLSALREFLDAYNMCPKLTFYTTTYNNITRITGAVIKIVSKTGNYGSTHNIDDFNDVRETKVMDKNSFGVTVVSNAENVTSSNPKTFPSTGSVRLSSRNYKIVESTTINDGVIRLPSKVFKGNWIKMLYRVHAYVEIVSNGTNIGTQSLYYYASDENSIDKLIQESKDYVHSVIPAADTDWNNFTFSHRSEIKRKLNAVGTITIYNGNNVNPVNGSIVKGDDVPYLTKFYHGGTSNPMVFVDKDTRECLPDKHQGIAWERGSNIISGFDFLSSSGGGFTTIDVKFEDTDYRSSEKVIVKFSSNGLSISIELPDSGEEVVKNASSAVPLATQLPRWSFIVNYYPMSDLKIKIDNQRDKKDVQLYNQTGRVTDCVALSKLINSYSKEISSDTITRYAQYYNYSNVPKVGDIVKSGNVDYVINNVSINFTENEEDFPIGFYYIDCEFTMCKYVSTKSLMVNPNTNIRDYGIPQNFNVKRKQLYRDYYELCYQTYDDQTNDEYIPYEKIFAFPYETNELMDLIAVMQIGYSEQVEGSYYWYYQLETTNYYLDKMLCIVLDFQDNNIIGYGSQNVFSGFDISRVFTGMVDTLNTPISYVDTKGKCSSIFIEFCSNEQITSIYNTYQNDHGGQSFTGSLYNYSVFIPEEIFDAAVENHTFQIIEANYLKDPLEIPVFEYVCQVDDSNDVLIGDDFLKQRPNCRYLYSYVIGGEGQTLKPETVVSNDVIEHRISDDSYKINNGCNITLVEAEGFARMVNIRFLTLVRVYPNNTKGFGNDVDMTQYEGRDVAVFRHWYNLDTQQQGYDLLFIARKIPSDHIQNTSRVNLEINHYKLK